MSNPSEGNTFSSAGRFPSSYPQRSHRPTDETLAVVDVNVNGPSITRRYVVGGSNFGGGIADLTTSGNIAVGGGGDGGVVRAEKPACRVCGKKFSKLPAVWGHMQVHSPKPKRGGTLAPSPSGPLGGAAGSQGEGGSSGGEGRTGEGGSSSPVRVPIFDPIQPVEGAADPAEEGNVREGNESRIDLNILPADEESLAAIRRWKM